MVFLWLVGIRTDKEKQSQIKRLEKFHAKNSKKADKVLEQIRESTNENSNTFAILMDAVNTCSLGQITEALFRAGGQYRRNM